MRLMARAGNDTPSGATAFSAEQERRARILTLPFSYGPPAAASEIGDCLQPEHQRIWIGAGAAGVDHVLDVRPHLQAGERPVGVVELHGVFVALHGDRTGSDQVLAGQVLKLFRPGDAAVDVGGADPKSDVVLGPRPEWAGIGQTACDLIIGGRGAAVGHRRVQEQA
jgi:hypothetical protein